MGKLLKHIIGCFTLVGLFICHYYGVTRYTHSHVINGAVVVHSHYYNETGNAQSQLPTHQHTTHEVIFLSMFSNFQIEIPTPYVVPPITIVSINNDLYESEYHIENPSLTFILGRAPPYLHL